MADAHALHNDYSKFIFCKFIHIAKILTSFMNYFTISNSEVKFIILSFSGIFCVISNWKKEHAFKFKERRIFLLHFNTEYNHVHLKYLETINQSPQICDYKPAVSTSLRIFISLKHSRRICSSSLKCLITP